MIIAVVHWTAHLEISVKNTSLRTKIYIVRFRA